MFSNIAGNKTFVLPSQDTLASITIINAESCLIGEEDFLKLPSGMSLYCATNWRLAVLWSRVNGGLTAGLRAWIPLSWRQFLIVCSQIVIPVALRNCWLRVLALSNLWRWDIVAIGNIPVIHCWRLSWMATFWSFFNTPCAKKTLPYSLNNRLRDVKLSRWITLGCPSLKHT